MLPCVRSRSGSLLLPIDLSLYWQPSENTYILSTNKRHTVAPETQQSARRRLHPNNTRMFHSIELIMFYSTALMMFYCYFQVSFILDQLEHIAVSGRGRGHPFADRPLVILADKNKEDMDRLVRATVFSKQILCWQI